MAQELGDLLSHENEHRDTNNHAKEGHDELHDDAGAPKHKGFQPKELLHSHGGVHQEHVLKGEPLPDLIMCTTTLLQRIDHLDDIVCVLEDKAVTGRSSGCSSPHTPPATVGASVGRFSSGPPTPSSLERRCKPAESVLEEVEEKGTLVERVNFLEERVSKLQRILSTKSSEIAYPITLSTIPSLERDEHDQTALPELSAIEKHEVVLSHEHEQNLKQQSHDHLHSQPQKTMEQQLQGDQDIQKYHNPYEGPESASSSSSTTVDEGTKKHGHRKSLKRARRLGKWLSKRLHLPFARRKNTHQDMVVFLNRLCWDLHSRSRHCWHFKRGALHPECEAQSGGNIGHVCS